MRDSSKIAVIIYGAPGSGKGTQADLLAKKFNLIHFDTGQYLESIVHDPKNKNNARIRKEKNLFDTGRLLTSSWVLEIISGKARQIARAGWGLVFSGSPRTFYEAFGKSKNSGLIKILEEEYGRSKIFFFLLKVHSNTSIQRNSQRLICSNCGRQLLGFYSQFYQLKHHHIGCPFCAAALRKRTLDNPETIKIRLKEYKERTNPIFAGLKKHGYNLHQIDGELLPYKVFAQIFKKIKI